MDKYRFAVCDDEEAVRSLISGWLLKSPYKAEIKEYDSGEELLRDIDAGVNPDILFLSCGFKLFNVITSKRLIDHLCYGDSGQNGRCFRC